MNDLSDHLIERLPLRTVERSFRIPLSFGQRRFWFIHQFDGPSATYNIPLVLRLAGAFDEDLFERAFRDVVERHESLRTVIEDVDGVGYQSIREQSAALPTTTRVKLKEAELEGAVSHAAGYCFDLSGEIPIRAWIFDLGGNRRVLLLVLHHIAGDGWSFAPLLRDLSEAYRARSEGRSPIWPKLEIQYADYTVWQAEMLGEAGDPDSLLSRQTAYWKAELAGVPEQLGLPTDRTRKSKSTYRGDRIWFRLDPETYRKIRALMRQTRASLFMVLHAGVALLLTKLGAGNDIPIGSPIAGRSDDVLNELVGLFINTLVLRTDTSGNPTFRELLARVRAKALQAYANQDVPFEHLVEALNPSRSLTHHPVFQVMLVLQNNADATLSLPNVEATAMPHDFGTAKFDLTFAFREVRDEAGKPQTLDIQLEYANDLFDRSTAQRIGTELHRLLIRVGNDPEGSASELFD